MKHFFLKKEMINSILNPYQDHFIYLDDQSVVLDTEKNTLTGRTLYLGSRYLKEFVKSKIFNSAEAILASNQIGIVLLLSAIAFKNNIIETEDQLNGIVLNHLHDAWNIVVSHQEISCKKMIPNHFDTFPFKSELIQFRKTRRGIFFCLNCTFGEENNFSVISNGFILNENAH